MLMHLTCLILWTVCGAALHEPFALRLSLSLPVYTEGDGVKTEPIITQGNQTV